MRGVLVFIFLLMSAGLSHARPGNSYGEADDFTGTWHNVEVRKSQVIKIVITPKYEGKFCVQIYGLSHGEPVLFGEETGRLFVARYPREREQDNAAVLVRINRPGWVRGGVLLRFNGRGEIVSHAVLHFEDERGNIYSVERFAPAERDRGYYGDDEDHEYRNGEHRRYYR